MVLTIREKLFYLNQQKRKEHYLKINSDMENDEEITQEQKN
jgi:hypothetical protein